MKLPKRPILLIVLLFIILPLDVQRHVIINNKIFYGQIPFFDVNPYPLSKLGADNILAVVLRFFICEINSYYFEGV